MRISIQWARHNSSDWEDYTTESWRDLPRQNRPNLNVTLSSQRGLVNEVCVQGCCFSGDYYVIEDLPGGGCRITVVNDDSDDWDAGEFLARVVEFQPLAADPAMGGAINTRQTQTVYAGPTLYAQYQANPVHNMTLLPWADFNPPPESLRRYGIWMSEGLYHAHRDARTPRDWREWTEGLPAYELRDGMVKVQRTQNRYHVPDGTITFYDNAVPNPTSGPHSPDFDNALSTNVIPGGPTTQQSTGINQNGRLCVGLYTLSTWPGSAAWPTGIYRCQMDVSSVDTDLTYGLLTQGNEAGHFGRLGSLLLSDLETKTQAQSAFSLTGLKLATTGTVSWSAGAFGDRFEALIAAVRATGHGNQQITFRKQTADSFCDGPWENPNAQNANTAFFGSNS